MKYIKRYENIINIQISSVIGEYLFYKFLYSLHNDLIKICDVRIQSDFYVCFYFKSNITISGVYFDDIINLRNHIFETYNINKKYIYIDNTETNSLLLEIVIPIEDDSLVKLQTDAFENLQKIKKAIKYNII
jgi:hypothetical protein